MTGLAQRLPLPRSIAGRLAALFAALSLLVFGLCAAVLYGHLREVIEHERRHAQRIKLELVVQMVDRLRAGGPVAAHWPRIEAELAVLARSDRSTHFWVFCDEAGRPGCSAPRPALEAVAPGPDWTPLTAEAAAVTVVSKAPGAVLQMISKDLAGLPPGDRVRVVVGSHVGRAGFMLERFAWLIAAVSLSGALAMAFLGGALARWTLRPVRRLSEAASTIGPQQLSLRLPLPDAADELDALVRAFNSALDRLQEAFLQMQTFNADVAHELRTPLTTLIGATQVALSRPREAQDLREVLAGNLEDAERLATMVRDMLFLARADHGEQALTLQPTDLRVLATETLEFFEPLLEEQGREVVLHGQARALVNPGLLKRALSNLIANALQYGDPAGPVTVELGQDGSAVRLEVVNPGPPLDESTQRRMFDRFYRADAARGREGQHAGLGLAIVKAVATMHGGTVQVRSHAGQVAIGLRLPQQAAPG
ncbi:heavy metal sensor signal transduction histidine kinase [Sphaerotilus hippei]|uniref:Sensor protein n=1 Tax=Sphaerotilus hippei TaxID=744406 RepID=A0A318GXA3_9BURK|nr:heavy metal sensor histidine kinase [Sphaerotilus hippei]PXW94324.1 heavy metal sensor signal transduction histidine kinase [Sphaerotilus hippei]